MTFCVMVCVVWLVRSALVVYYVWYIGTLIISFCFSGSGTEVILKN